MRYALSKTDMASYFFVRNGDELRSKIPDRLRETVFNPSDNLDRLKSDLIKSGKEVFDGYPAQYQGLVIGGGKWPVAQVRQDYKM